MSQWAGRGLPGQSGVGSAAAMAHTLITKSM